MSKMVGKLFMLAAATAVLLASAGCSIPQKETSKEKEHYYEVLSGDTGSTLQSIVDEDTIKIIDDFSVSAVGKNTIEDLPDGLTPQYEFVCYQEKTRLASQSPDSPKTYEEIERITLYNDSTYATFKYAPSAVKNLPVSEEMMTFTYSLTSEELQSLLKAAE